MEKFEVVENSRKELISKMVIKKDVADYILTQLHEQYFTKGDVDSTLMVSKIIFVLNSLANFVKEKHAIYKGKIFVSGVSKHHFAPSKNKVYLETLYGEIDYFITQLEEKGLNLEEEMKNFGF